MLNRGKTDIALPKGVKTLVGDMNGQAYGELGDGKFDVVCQFRAYTADQVSRDIETFTGKTGQYIFISSASAYQKPAHHYIITERTPLVNPYWEYSRNKIACEKLIRSRRSCPAPSSGRATRCAPACRSRSAIPTPPFAA